MLSESDFHDRFCFKKHKRLALAVFVIYAFFTAVSIHTLLTYPDRPFGTGSFRYSTAIGALLALYIARGLFRDAQCTSEKVILWCLISALAVSLMAVLGLVSPHLARELHLPLDGLLLLSIATDLRAAYPHE